MNISGFFWLISAVGYPLLVCDQIQYMRYFKMDTRDIFNRIFVLLGILVFLIAVNLLLTKRGI